MEVVEVNSLESESDNILSASVDSFFEEKPEIKEEVEKVEVSETEEEPEIKEEASEEEVEEETEEEEAADEETEIEEGETKDLSESLKGVFNKDYINLLESIEDPKLRSDLIKAGKNQRADIDRKRLELGETKKLVETLDETVKANNLPYNKQQYAGYMKNLVGFDALFTKDPKLAIESLAKTANIDLNTLGTTPVQEPKEGDDYEDYRTPEEIKRDQEIETLKQELSLIKNHNQQQEQVSVQQEINNFANTKDADGNPKYPHFERVSNDMSLLMKGNINLDMDKAYQRAILLDDDLMASRDQDILRKAETKRKAEIVKAKKLKRQSVRSSKVSSTISDPDAALENIVNDFFGS